MNYRVTVNLPGTPEGAEVVVHGLGQIQNGSSRVVNDIEWLKFSHANRVPLWDDKKQRDVYETDKEFLNRFSNPDAAVFISETDEEPEPPVDPLASETPAQAHERQLIERHEAEQDSKHVGKNADDKKTKGGDK